MRVGADVDASERVGGADQEVEGAVVIIVEDGQRPAQIADDCVEVAVAVDVAESRRRVVAEIEAVERIGDAGQFGEAAVAIALKGVQLAVEAADDEVLIGVLVEKECGRVRVAEQLAVERVGGADQLAERPVAIVEERPERAAAVAGDQVDGPVTFRSMKQGAASGPRLRPSNGLSSPVSASQLAVWPRA